MLLEEFSTIFDRPEKVKKLREYILSLAVRGKLIEQDENDEPASVLLERIREEKDRLVKEKKIKKEKALPEINEDEIPYDLPRGWEWVRLGELGLTQTGTTPSTKNTEYFGGNIPFIKPADISENGVIYNNESLTELGLEKGRLIEANSVLMVCIGGAIGKNYFIDRDCSCNQQINAITGLCGIGNKFLHYFVSSNEFYEQIISTATGSATPIINKSKWEQLLVQLPPLNEQKRIVEKVDYLMEFCDKLEAQLVKKVKYSSLSAKSVLNGVSNCSSYEELEEALRFIIKNFKDLTLADGAVGELKNAILSLAVKGKLVPQDENDEPASMLIERIREEKDRLVKEKKIKKEKVIPEISDDEIPYELPKGWEWTRLGYITNYGTNISIKPEDIQDNTWVLELEDIEKDTSKILQRLYFKERKSKSTKLIFKKDDVLYCKLRPYLNKVVIVNSNGVCSSEIMPLRGYYGIYPKYLMYALKRPDFLRYTNEITYGTKMPRLGTEDGRKSLFPLPPFNEQKRIVDRIDILMGICDELQLKIEKSNKYSEQLMESILKKHRD